jgi:ubiquinone/menaquinone biosynthesis C-methylase UbiE
MEYVEVDQRQIEMLYTRLTRNDSPTYLSEMLKVYREMYKVLKPNGLAIIVIKPYIRNKKVVDLPYYTYLLMERVGFRLEKLYKFRLPAKSFWRILYHRRFPTVPIIAHEYVIVTRKQPEK